VTPERVWWERVPQVLRRPRAVFAALRDEDTRDDLDARQEIMLALAWLTGLAWLLADPLAGEIYDDPEFDWLLALVWGFAGGGIVGVAVYWGVGAALFLGLRGLGSRRSFREARHLLGYASVPFALSSVVFLVKLAAFGSDTLRTGGADGGTGGQALAAVQSAFGVWTLALVLAGVRVVERWSWARSLGAIGLMLLFGVAIQIVIAGL
jgi:hypothetical protein